MLPAPIDPLLNLAASCEPSCLPSINLSFSHLKDPTQDPKLSIPAQQKHPAKYRETSLPEEGIHRLLFREQGQAASLRFRDSACLVTTPPGYDSGWSGAYYVVMFIYDLA